MSDPQRTTTLVFDVLGTLLDEDSGQLRAVEELGGIDAEKINGLELWRT